MDFNLSETKYLPLTPAISLATRLLRTHLHFFADICGTTLAITSLVEELIGVQTIIAPIVRITPTVARAIQTLNGTCGEERLGEVELEATEGGLIDGPEGVSNAGSL
jgi:hypothetical protein